jgi:hypothetical protein
MFIKKATVIFALVVGAAVLIAFLVPIASAAGTIIAMKMIAGYSAALAVGGATGGMAVAAGRTMTRLAGLPV